MNKDVLLLIGAGQIGMAIARRMGYGKKIVIGDKNVKNALAICEIMKNVISNFLMDGGATASYFYGDLKPE